MSIIALTHGLRDFLNRGDTAAQVQNGYPSGDALAGVFKACERTLTQAVETMSEEDMAWRPFPETPSASYYLWHVARVQDALLHKQILNRPEINETHGYAREFGLPLEDTGQAYTATQRAHFQEPPKKALLEYLGLTFQAVLRTIEELGPEGLDIETDSGMRRIRYLITLTTHANLHAGAINHIREVLTASREVPAEN